MIELIMLALGSIAFVCIVGEIKDHIERRDRKRNEKEKE